MLSVGFHQLFDGIQAQEQMPCVLPAVCSRRLWPTATVAEGRKAMSHLNTSSLRPVMIGRCVCSMMSLQSSEACILAGQQGCGPSLEGSCRAKPAHREGDMSGERECSSKPGVMVRSCLLGRYVATRPRRGQ